MPQQDHPPHPLKLPPRPLKWALALGLFLGAVLIGILLLDLDSFRGPIMDRLNRATGLSIKIESLTLSFSHGLSLRCGGVKVRSGDGSREIFAAQDLFLDAELRPLLDRQLKIRRITLVRPAMKIPGGAAGPAVPATARASEEEPKSSPPGAPGPPPGGPAPDPMEPVRKILQHPDLSLRSVEIQNGELILLRPESGSLPAAEIPVRIDARLDLSRPRPNQVNLESELLQVAVENLRLQGKIRTGDLLAPHVPVNIDLESEPLPLDHLKEFARTVAGPDAFPAGLKSGRLEMLSVHIEGPVDPARHPLGELVMTSGFRIVDLRIEPPANRLTKDILLPQLEGEGLWNKGTLHYKIKGALWEGTLHSTLVVNLPQAAEGIFEGTFNADLRLKDLNLAAGGLDGSGQWTPTAGTVFGDFKAQGPVGGAATDLLRTDGRLHAEDLVLGREKNGQAAQAALTVHRKTSKRTLAGIQLKEARFNGFAMNTAKANLTIEADKISLMNGHILPPHGLILVSGDYRPRPETYVLRIRGKDLQMEDFLKEQMEGSGHFEGMFQGNLKTFSRARERGEAADFPHIAEGLSGKLSIQLKDGGIRTLPLVDALLTLLNPTSAATAQKRGINYDHLDGDFKIWNGSAVTDNLRMKGPQMNLDALAGTNLVTGKLDGEIKVMPMQLVDSIVKAVPLLGKILTGGGRGGLVETYFKLGGTLERPQLTLLKGKSLFGKPAGILEELVKTPGRWVQSLETE